MPDSSRRDPPAGSASARSLADAVVGPEEGDRLAEGRPAVPAQEPSAATPGKGGGSAEDEREQYYRHLEERGALKDVDEDNRPLVAAVHRDPLRYPDGRVERLGYS